VTTEGEKKMGRWERERSEVIRVNLPSYALQPETTPPWEPIAAALTRGQKCTRAARVDWSSGRRWVRVGELGERG
jgi:hypothetical protein